MENKSDISLFLREKQICNKIEELNIQLVEFSEKDVSRDNLLHSYRIYLFGITERSESVCVKVDNFKPFFYIEVPKNFRQQDLQDFKAQLMETEYINKSGEAKTYKYSLNNSDFELLESLKCDGFQNDKTKFIKINFVSIFGYRNLKNYFMEFIVNMENIKFKNLSWKPRLYESDISPLLRFFHKKDIKTCGWINVMDHDISMDRETFCQYECTADHNNIEPLDNDVIGPLTILSFDIECTSGDGSFPMANRKEDKIIQIGSTIERYNEPNIYYNNIITLGGCNKIENADVISCETEEEVFYEWMKLIKRIDPDVITGYNISGFDYKYMWERINFLMGENTARAKKVLEVGRLRKSVFLIKKVLESSALGQNILSYYDMNGRINVDLYSHIKKEFKLESYKLDNVAKKFIGSQKNDVSPSDIFRLQKGSDDDRKTIAEYCIQDCKLCNKLMTKLSVLENTFGMANTCYIPNNYIHYRGQGIKGHSLVVKYAAELGYIIPSSVIEANIGEYKGATVIEPTIGSHFYPVTCLDFASLYPSCMISHNLCISSIITNDKYLNLPGRTYKTISWKDADTGVEKKYIYIQPTNENTRALLPTILQQLLKKRSETRKKQEKEKDPFKNNILNGVQLSYKITANSIYGLLGARTSAISRPEIAACITTTGRAMLDIAQKGVENHFIGASIIYGDTDSIFVKFDLKNHKETCEFHENNAEERFTKLKYFINKYVKQLETDLVNGKEIEIRHSIQETAIKKCKFQLYKKCDCENYTDLMSKEALKKSMILGTQAEKLFSYVLPYPHKLCYEKTYLPLISFAKKRYIGYLYENNVEKGKLDYKGIVLKRRDNAPIVKKFYNGSIDLILKKDFNGALNFIKTELKNMFANKYDISNFTLTKTLKTLETYKISFLKKKFLIEGAVKTFEFLLLLNKHISVAELNNLLLLISYKGSVDKILELVRDNKVNFIDAILAEDGLKTALSLSSFDIYKLINENKFKYRTKIHFSIFSDILELADFDISMFKNIEKIMDSENYIKVNDFIDTYKHIYTNLFRQKVSQSHVALNEKIKLRDLGSAYAVADRIPYCFVKIKKTNKKLLQSDIVETPSYIKEKGIKIDYIYYIEKQIKIPLIQLFESIDKDKEINNLFNEYIIRDKNIKNNVKDITMLLS